MSIFVDEALALAKNFKIVPIPHKGKAPVLKDWQNRATEDPEQVKQWFAGSEPMNAGILTGERSGVIVIDVDKKSGGLESLQALFDQHGAFPLTYTVVTGSGGLHYYFKHPGFYVWGAKGKLAPGVDIQGENNQVVAPGSTHPSGGIYKVAAERSVEEVSIADLPGWLHDWLRNYKQDGKSLVATSAEPKGKSKKPKKEDATIASGERNDTLFRRGAALRARGLSETEILGALWAINKSECKEPLEPEEIKLIAESVMRYKGGDEGGRPTIITSDQESQILRNAIAALAAYEDAPYVMGDQLARVRDDLEEPEIEHHDADSLLGDLIKAANWVSRNKDGDLTKSKPSAQLAKVILREKRLPFRFLRGITVTPVLRADGSLITTSGYDPESGLFLNLQPSIANLEIPASPSEEQVQEAVSLILDYWLGDFPFRDQASRANILAGFLTILMRPNIIGHVPIMAVNTSGHGVGKTLLCEVLALAATGVVPATDGIGKDDEETRKNITSLMLEGKAVLLFDNADQLTDSRSLVRLITSTNWGDRLLGKNQSVNRPTCYTSWMMNGSNMEFKTDLQRRAFLIDLDPEKKKKLYKIKNLAKWTIENRGRLLQAGYTLVRAWVDQGRPEGAEEPPESFESWTSIVGGILRTASVSGFLGNTEEFKESQDLETAGWKPFLEIVHRDFQGKSVCIKDMLPVADKYDLLGWILARHDGNEKARSTALGMALSRIQGC